MNRLLPRILVLGTVLLTASRLLAAAPTVTTSAATSITTSSAQLNGAGIPNGEQTTGWFRISSTDPGTCDDTFGTRVPVSSGTDLGAGTGSVPFSINATGLTSTVTYYFCAIVQNASGTAFGAVLSFTVPGAPAVTTTGASSISSSTAVLEATSNPNAASSTGWFRYSTTNPGTCDDTFGTRAPSSGATSLGSGTSPVGYTRTVSGLIPGATYYFCAISSNAYGTSFGTLLSFTALANAPVVSTNSATLVTGTTAQLNGSANPGGAATTGWFRYATTSPGTCDDVFGTRGPTTGGSALGTGNSSVAYGVGVTGLSSATTYYYCAIAENSVGKSFGTVRSFTTPSPPTVNTTAATSISSSSATLRGNATPNGASTTGWFRYSLTDPGTCDDVFGSRAPATGGTSLGSGSSAISYSRSVSGLSVGTTYYYCAIAQNSEGLAFGTVMFFVTDDVPTVTTEAATLITSNSVTFNGTGTANGASTYGFFRFSTSNPGTCSNSFGSRWPTSSGSDTYLGTGTTPTAFARSRTSLTPGTTYYFCALARNSYGTSWGTVQSFTTLAALPTVSTSNASLLTGTTAQLNGSSNPGGAATSGWFRFATASPGSCNDSFGTRAPTTGGDALGSGTSTVTFNDAVTGLTAGMTYYYCAIAQNSVGIAFGTVRTFTTPTPPVATTITPSSVGNTSATLRGTGTPNLAVTTGWFRYSATDPGTCDDSFGSRAPSTGGTNLGAGSSAVSYSRSISGLSVGTTYYYCAIVSSAEGTSFGVVVSFITDDVPVVTTDPATLVTSTSVTFNGTGTANGSNTYGFFRFSTTSPGTCDNSFGTRWPSSSGSDTYIGGAATPTAFARSRTSLLPGTTYYFCALARNSYGTSWGTVLSFTTLANAPTVSTYSATALTATTAQLRGGSNPGGATTTAWFRYDTSSPGTCNDTFGTRTPATGGDDLGSGTSTVSFNENITGLSAGTTYYYCAIAENSVGKTLGSVVSFTTPTPPLVTTTAAQSITNSSVSLRGNADPNGSATTGWFRYSLTDPITCDDAFGSRAPTTGGTTLGSGTSAVNYSRTVSSLSAGTTYYYCAIASSAEGTAFGAVLSFTTDDVPGVTTEPPTSVTSTSVTFNGTGDPNGASTYGFYRFSTTSPGTCDNSFGTRWPSSSGSDTYIGTGSAPVAFARSRTSLLPGTTYYYCALARNSYGTSWGTVLSFTTLANAPIVSTYSATALTGTTAQLRGGGNPGGAATDGWFRYATSSPGTCNDSFGTRAPTTGADALGSGTSTVSFNEDVTGLTAGTTYYYCAIAENSVGKTFGSMVTFTTPTPPTATTNTATSIGNTSGTLRGAGVPNGATTSGWFRYSSTDPGTCDDLFGSRAPSTGGTNLGAGTSSVAYSRSVSGLSVGTTYYYCAIVSSAEGIAFGAVLTFQTADAPTVTTEPATSVTSTSAVFRGTAVPNSSGTYGFFRFSTTDPGTCSNSFGTRWPSSSGSDTYLGTGTAPVAFARTRSSLLPGTTYYYCALARNSYGTSWGTVLSFTTLANAPTVSTYSATALTGTTAQLRGGSNPGGAATTAWFRYATTSPGTCNDTFGTRAPTTGGDALGAGTSTVSFNEDLTGLTAGLTYYYCAIAENSVGKTFGSVVSFTTPTPPTVTTSAATSITNSSMTLRGAGTPNGATTTGWFRYALTDPGTCNDSFGSRAPTTGGTSLGSGTSAVSYARSVSGLSAGTTYYVCAIVSSAEGTAFGTVLPITTADAPEVTTEPPTSVTSSSVTFNGSADPNGASTYGYFRFSTSSPGVCSDAFGSRWPSSSGSDTYLGTGTAPVAYARSRTSLQPGTTYYYCALARSSYGTRWGSVQSFTTLSIAPTVSTSSAISVAPTSATLRGSANPRGSATTAWFRYGTASPGTCNDSFGTRAPAAGGSNLGSSTSTVAYSEGITALTPGTTYYFCAIAQNSIGISFGTVRNFTTTTPPTVFTLAATPVTSTTATLNASVNPNSYTSTGWFRYDTTDPGACDDTFGTVTPTSSLGSGSVAIAMARPLTGLAPATTYYFCGLSSSSVGLSMGVVLSFTTPAAPPSVSTDAATVVTASTATLNGTINPNGDTTSAWFRHSTSNPGTCNDSFGTRAPTTGGTDLGAGNGAVAHPLPVSSLASGTTYYFCALASSSVGSSVGTILSFTTPGAPTVTTFAATSVSSSGATLEGSADPNLDGTTGYFRYSATDPGTCDDTFGTRAPASGGTDLGSGAIAVPYDEGVTGLSSGTTYYYCALAQNSVGTGFGPLETFTTPATPTVTTTAASLVTSTAATLNASANPNLSSATGWFRYSTSDPGTCDDSFGIRTPSSGGTALGAGSSPIPYSRAVTGLTAGLTYYFCGIASNATGTDVGTVLSFTTPGAPSVNSLAATSVSGTGATLEGSANPNLSATTAWFRYSATNPGACNDSFGTRAPGTGGASLGAGTAVVPFSQAITGLTAGTTYYVCAIAQNTEGLGFGSVQSFSTASTPTVVSTSASALSSTGATLNGLANPQLSNTTGWFRYATTDPGACNDGFGTRVPASGGTDVGAGGSSISFDEAVTGLSSGTTYYFCAIAANAVGTAYGVVLNFTTPAAPSVTTAAASAINATVATLEGSANPNLASTTGWYRYSSTNPGTCDDSFGTRTPSSGGASLGAGSSPVPYSEAVSSLASFTTYYFCAIAQNAEGTSFGAVLSFTTPAVPGVTTTTVTSVTTSSAVLGGTGNPNLNASTGWFRYSSTDPSTCNDSFGTRTPAAGGTSLGAGSSPIPFSQAIAGLASGTTYFVCAIAQNAEGTGFGTVISFTTTGAPTVTSLPATSVTSSGATLEAEANPNLSSATGHFRYDTADPGTCDDSFGTRAPASGGTALGAGSSTVPYSESISGLTSGTTYYFCAIASNAEGTRFGSVRSFTTTATPTVTTVASTSVTGSTATFEGLANPNLAATTGWFRYDTTNPGTCDDSFGTRAPAAGGSSLGAGSSAIPFTEAVSGLSAGTTYYFCALAQNAVGTSFGSMRVFITADLPSVTTTAASAISASGATLEASANPNRSTTTGWLRYDTSNPGACNDSFGTRAPATGGASLGLGGAVISYSEIVAGLLPSTTYYFCAIAQNAEGTGFGAVLSFSTPSAPTVTTSAASSVTSTGAVLAGAATPNLESTSGWFRYSSVDPSSCNDSFGTRAPSSGGTTLGAGSAPVPYSQAITGLAAGTTYYFCAVAQNATGAGFGPVLSFTTPAAPTVLTLAPTSLTSSGATLEGSANPNLGTTTGWFRYGTTNPGSCNDSFGTRAPGAGGDLLGSGSLDVPYSRTVTGLASAATYYYCAISENAAGMRFGVVLSFTTLATPSATTLAATAVTGTGATLNGSANPNLDPTTAWFRYASIDPGACNDSFGIRAPGSGGTALGAGSTPIAHTQAITGLSAGTTYYFCTIAQNGIGTDLGGVLTFTTPAPPVVTTLAATSVAGWGADLNASANPNQGATTGWFRYSGTDPGTCDDSFGTRAPAGGGTDLGAGNSPATYSESVTGLAPSTSYFFCAIAQNAEGITFGPVLSFTTSTAPLVNTVAATSVTNTGAVLNGSANPNLNATTGWFRFSNTDPSFCNDSFGTRTPASGGTDVGAGGSAVPYSRAISGLVPGSTYYFCAIAQNVTGLGFGTVSSFTTPAAPAVTSLPATSVTSTTATLEGAAIPNQSATTGWFRYATTAPGSCDDSFGTRAPFFGGSSLGSGIGAVTYSESISGLAPATTYFYCALAQNVVGTAFGAVLTFTTPAAPVVTTVAVGSVTSSGARLEGSANPNLNAATGYFRYDTSNPGTCNDAFGTRAPIAGGAPLGAGSSPVSFAEVLGGLSPATTYYFCALAQNGIGSGVGALLSFTTTAAPAVTTLAASGMSHTTATIAGSANPNLGPATGWFRYDTVDPGSCDDTFGLRAPVSGGSALGAGSTPVLYGEALAGLLPGSTYYFCAIADNAAGPGFGAVLTFTTSATPRVTTETADSVSNRAATFNGTADASGLATTGWFRHDTVDPGSCDDSFGQRAPATGGSAIGSGSSPVAFAEALTGLLPNTTYFFCALAQNSDGMGFGELLLVTTPADLPSVTTDAPTSVDISSAQLNGTANPNADATTGWFRYDTIDPVSCDDTFGSRLPASGGADLGSGIDPVAYTEPLAALEPGLTYYYCAIAENGLGLGFGSVQLFLTGADAPTVTTEAATDILGTSATLAGTGNPEGAEATGWFRWGDVDPATCDDSFGSRVPAVDGVALGAVFNPVPFSLNLADLVPARTYYYCAAAGNLAGATFGEVLSFTTAEVPPEVQTLASMTDADSVTMAGAANPLGYQASAWFRYSLQEPTNCDDSFGTRVPQNPSDDTNMGTGTVPVQYSESIPNPGAGTYYFCALAQSTAGTAHGSVMSFTVAAPPDPSATRGCGCSSAATSGPVGPRLAAAVFALFGALLLRRRRRPRAG